MLCAAGTTSVVVLRPENDTDRCLQGCYNGDCGAGTDNYLSLANLCDERLSQLWLISSQNRRLVNVASGSCLSITSDDVVSIASCSNDTPAQTWSWYANGSLTPQSNPGSFLTTCTAGSVGCNAEIMNMISNDGEMMTISNDTAAAAESWDQTAPGDCLAACNFDVTQKLFRCSRISCRPCCTSYRMNNLQCRGT